ncbi:LIM and SH3 domain protein 1, partial [Silurus meridionalis]
FWHKGCFSCEVCKMTLNMKNYKGFDKKPYCNAHYPKTSFTSVADTPENLRLKQQSKMQSQVLYKEEFEKSKGKGFSVVADTPEMQRIKKTQDQISNVGQTRAVQLHVFYVCCRLNIMRILRRVKWEEKFPIHHLNITQLQVYTILHSYQTQSSLIGMFGLLYGIEPDFHCKGGTKCYTFCFSLSIFLFSPAYQPPAASQNYHYEPEPKRYRAVYDYAAADEDEVSFLDGDVIVDVQPIDEGWMYGRVERTGQQGMLPANYVEAI